VSFVFILLEFWFLFLALLSQDISVGIVAELQAVQLRTWGLIPNRTKLLIFFKAFRLALSIMKPPVYWVLGFFPHR
jgi:hypothetical protein